MEDKNPILNNETSPVQWTLVIKSPHYLAYRFWLKQPGGAWEQLVEGTSEDGIADSGSFQAVAGTEFYYSMGIGSTHPNSKFDVAIVMTQDNVVIENGIIQKQGKVDSNGVAARNGQVTFQIPA